MNYDHGIDDTIFNNGIKTMQEEVRIVREGGRGILVWEITEDTIGQYSLLKAIYDTRKESKVIVLD